MLDGSQHGSVAGAEAAPHYYLSNFEFALADISRRYGDVIGRPEALFLATFPRLPMPSRALLVRMLMRRPTLFRHSALNYPEIGPLEVASAPLIELGWLDPAPILTLQELFALLRKDELRSCLTASARHMSKRAMFEELCIRNSAPKAMREWSPFFTEPILRMRIAPICERLRLLFFGNYHQDWSAFVLAHLKLIRFEHTAFSTASRAFERAEDLDMLHQLFVARRRLENGDDPAAVMSATPHAPCPCDWIETKRQKLLYRIAFAMERAQRIEEAQTVYAISEHPESYVRTIRIHERQGHWNIALQICERAMIRCHADLDRGRLVRARRRLRKRLGHHADPIEAVVRPQTEALQLDPVPEPTSVEVRVRDELQRRHPDAKIFYVENTLITGLFGLLCWDVIFAALPGAFFHAFQREPADLTAADFYARRATLFQARLAQLQSGEYQKTIRSHYLAKHGTANAFVYWNAWTPELLELALDCIPAAHLHGWFEILARDRSANRTGFPDLVEFRPGQNSYRLIEVKGPGDRLQANQRRCLGICARLGMRVVVCHVTFADAPPRAAVA